MFKTENRLRRFFKYRQRGDSKYESKYNALFDECSCLEITQKICMNDNIQPECAFFAMYKMNSKNVLKRAGEYFETQETLAIETIRLLRKKCPKFNKIKYWMGVIAFYIYNTKLSARHRKCLKIKIICRKNENVLKYIITSKIAETIKYKNKQFSLESS